ncbi:cation:dicarboxylate symporter family transporter [Undibacterium sp. Ji50W]|uniref:cation:dicarboxylate symporter family transporter n=1 Tax=Undibacterium sp. Ji50W TaxID=3413041 RepID=UPI003BF2887B
MKLSFAFAFSFLKRRLYVQVICAVILGTGFGYLWPALGTELKPLGDAFIKLVKMMLAPLVFCTIAGGIASLNERRGIARTLLKAMAIFYLLTLLALLLGWLAAAIMQPGAGWHFHPAAADQNVMLAMSTLSSATENQGLARFVLHIIPATYVGAFAEPEVLPVLLLALLTGFAMARTRQAGDRMLTVVDEVSRLCFGIFGSIMKLAPIAAFASMAYTVGRHGIQSIAGFSYLILNFYLACAVFVVVILGGLARLHGFSLWKLLRYIREELFVVLGTSSSEPVLPPLMQKLQALGCKKDVAGLVLPMAYSFNLDGTAIYLTLASLFIAQACDIPLSNGQILGLIATMLLTSKGAAGVSGSGFVTLVATLTVIPDLPLAAATLLLGIDRFMSEARALTSTISNVVVCLVVAMWEGACDRNILKQQLDQRD